MPHWLSRLVRRLPHSYVLLALGAVFVAGIAWNLWRLYALTHDGRFIFRGGLLVLVYLAVAAQIVVTVPRDRL